MKKSLFLAVICFFAISCSNQGWLGYDSQGVATQLKQDDEIAVLERAEELVGAEYHQDFGKWWDMMMPSDRNSRTSGADTREEFIRQRKGEFENFRITDYDSAKLLVIGEKHAVTNAEISYEVREDGRTRTVTGCEKTLWLKLSGGWYWHQTGLDCNYMPSAEEIERLTSNLR